MKSRLLLAVVIVLAALGESYWWLTRRSVSVDTLDVVALERNGVQTASADSPKASLPLPETAPDPQSEVFPVRGSKENHRVAAATPGPDDFARTYGHSTLAELRAARVLISKQLSDAKDARLADLMSKFPELIANGEHGARVLALGERPVPADSQADAVIAWVAKNDDGTSAMRLVELNTFEDPVTAPLVAEKAWLELRIATLPKEL